MKTFNKGEVITVIGVSDFLACTVRRVYKATGEYTPEGKPVFTKNEKGARKKVTLRAFGKSDLVFSGDVPFKLDSEVQQPSTTPGIFSVTHWRGNACINLVGHGGTIVHHIIKANLNPEFIAYDIVMLIENDKEIPLFPEHPTNHAVVLRVREKTNANATTV